MIWRWFAELTLVACFLPAALVAAPTSGWAVDAKLEDVVAATGFSGCTVSQWDGRLQHSGWNFSQPLVVPAAHAPAWATGSGWARDEFIRRYGEATALVRLPTGQRQSGLLVRNSTIRAFATEAGPADAAVEHGIMLSRAPPTLVDATEGMVAPSPLGAANLSASVLSLAAPGTGLPFHNHGAAWLTVLGGKKLVVLSPPRKQLTTPEFQLLQHRPPISWAVGPRRQAAAMFRAAGLKTRHCVLGAGDTVFIPCNWYHATLNLGHTLAVGGQQPASNDRGGESAPNACPTDTDAQANLGFVAATEAIRHALAAPGGEASEDNKKDLIQSLAIGEELLQRSLAVAPLRIESWIWRLRGALARRDEPALVEIAHQVAEQYEAAAEAQWMPPLRAVSSLVAIADSLPQGAAEQLLLRTAFHVGTKAGPGCLDQPHRYRAVGVEGSGAVRHKELHPPKALRQELTERFREHMGRSVREDV